MRQQSYSSDLKEYFKCLLDLEQCFKKGQPIGLVFLWGPEDFLLSNGIKEIKKFWSSTQKSLPQTLDTKDISDELKFSALWEERNIFDPASCYMIAKVEKLKNLAKLIRTIPSKACLQNPICISMKAKKIPTNISKELTRLKAITIPCNSPRDNELPILISSFTKELGLRLDHSALSLMIELIGNDLNKLFNELKKLSLIFADSSEVLSAQNISPYLGVLREDHAFTISQHLLNFQHFKVHLVIQNLLRKGESALALLGIISRHLRTALKIKKISTQNRSIQEISKHLRLPYRVVVSYCEYNKKITIGRLINALERCQEADSILKFSSKSSNDLILFEILDVI